MRLAIMQPYFFPYIGYFQLLNAVDKFVIYDNIQFSKTSWIHRNRILVNGDDRYITLSLKKDSDFLDVRERFLCERYKDENRKILRRIEGSYRNAPYFKEFFPIVCESLLYDEPNLFTFVDHSIKNVATYLSIKTPIIKSSEVNIDHSLKGQNKVLAFCRHLGALSYINLPGGRILYDETAFSKERVDLKFIQPKKFVYGQMARDFLPWLSIIDVLMFNPNHVVRRQLKSYVLL